MIEARTNQLLGKTGLADQVKSEIDALMKIKLEGNRTKKMFGLDI